MLNKRTLLDIIRHFIVFDKSKKEDKITGVTTIRTIKKLAAYHQYYAVNKTVESTLRASGYLLDKNGTFHGFKVMEAPENYGLTSVIPLPLQSSFSGRIPFRRKAGST